MNSNELARKRDLMLRVYHHEINRRRDIQKTKPKAYKKLFAMNPKRLDESCDGTHVWVPMTILWIHDGNGKGSMIDGFKRRGFSEATTFEHNGYRFVPQMCWNCVATRELVLPVMSWSERQKTLADHIAAAQKGKPRGKIGADVMLDDFDDLFA